MSATITKRISQNLDGISSRYNSHWSPTWVEESGTYGEQGELGVYPEIEVGGEWYGGIRNVSLRFNNITIPQGATIISAKITLTDNGTSGTSRTLNYKIYGIDEDDTAIFSTSSSGRTRTQTTASVDWDRTNYTTTDGNTIDSPSITTIVQEIVDRAGWASGNDMGFYIADDGSSAQNQNWNHKYYSSYSATAPLLTIEYDDGGSPSPSPSPSLSSSKSPSPSSSLSPSLSPSTTPSSSLSPSPEVPKKIRLLVAKTGINALKSTANYEKYKFHSDCGTLKYFYKGTASVTVKCNSVDLEVRGTATYAHNLGYFPFVEVYMKDPLGIYAYCPCTLTGASTWSKGGYTIDEDNINFFVDNSGYPSFSNDKTYTFIFFIFKNNLNL